MDLPLPNHMGGTLTLMTADADADADADAKGGLLLLLLLLTGLVLKSLGDRDDALTEEDRRGVRS
jgi:hypothetical protein